MQDRDLAYRLHQLLDAVPVPDGLGLEPARLRRAARGLRARRWAAVAAVVLLLAAAASPPGRAAAEAAGGWVVMQYRLASAETLDIDPERVCARGWSRRAPLLTGLAPDLSANQRWVLATRGHLPGQTYVIPYTECGDGVFVPTIEIRTMRLREVLAEDPSWPLPAYLPPGEDVPVRLSRMYDRWGRPLAVDLTFEYDPLPADEDRFDEVLYGLTRYLSDELPPHFKPVDDAGDRPTVYRSDACTGDVRKVDVRGVPAVIYGCGAEWAIHWWLEGARGELRTTLGPEELVRIAESLPALD